MPHLGRSRSSRKVSSPLRWMSTAVVVPSRMIQCTAPFGESPIFSSKSTSIHLSCSGVSGVRPITTPEFCTFSSIVGVPPLRRSDWVRIGELPVPGSLICMMWVKVVVAFSEFGMNIEYVIRQVWPRLHTRYGPPAGVRIPLTSWRCRSVMMSRSTMCMLKR
jgi:hypothetical protein